MYRNPPFRTPRSLPKWCFVRLVREAGAAAEPGQHMQGPADVHRLLVERASERETEAFWAVLLNTKGAVRAIVEVTTGTLNSSMAHPREVFRAAILAGAAGLIVVHNHPSGDPTPSADDKSVTRQLVDAGRLLDIPVYDHVIVTPQRYVSFAEAGLL